MKWLTLSLAFCLCVSLATCYQIGVGRADCTGPTVEVIFVSIFPSAIFFFFY